MRTTTLFFAFLLSFSSSFPALAQRTPLFRDFPTGAVYAGRHSEPDLSSRDAYAFRTRLREASREDVNFASHYRVVTWGCGTSCVSGAVVDVISGHVTFFPFSICCSAKIGEADFQPVLVRPNSRLIVFVGMRGEDPPDAAHFYEFTGRGFVYLASSKPFPPVAYVPLVETVPSPSAPSSPVRNAGCGSITDNQARLNCYDGKSGSNPPATTTESLNADDSPMSTAELKRLCTTDREKCGSRLQRSFNALVELGKEGGKQMVCPSTPPSTHDLVTYFMIAAESSEGNQAFGLVAIQAFVSAMPCP